MIQTIDVELPPFGEPSFATPGEAIAYAQKCKNNTRRGEDLIPYVGQTVVAVEWRDEVFRLQLDGGAVLQFALVEQAVDVTVLKIPLRPLWGNTTIEDMAIVRFRDDLTDIWARSELMRAMVGQVFRLAQVGEGLVFLYLSNRPILMVSILIDRATLRPFLYWRPTD